jgi:hypothetical protein
VKSDNLKQTIGSIAMESSSSSIVFGFFTVTSGRRTADGGESSNICMDMYATYLQCSVLGEKISAGLRMQASTDEEILTDGVMVFAIAHIAIIPKPEADSPRALLEVIEACVVPGDPTEKNYRSLAPDLTHPVLIILGHVSDVPKLQTGDSKQFTVLSDSVINDVVHQSSIRYVGF